MTYLVRDRAGERPAETRFTRDGAILLAMAWSSPKGEVVVMLCDRVIGWGIDGSWRWARPCPRPHPNDYEFCERCGRLRYVVDHSAPAPWGS